VPDPRRSARRRRRAPFLAAVAGIAGLALAGCTHTVRVGSDQTLEVALNEYRVNPSSASVPSGVVTLIVRNYGRLSHNLVVAGSGYVDGSTPPIPPGTEWTLLLDLTPGSYQMYSSLLNDQALGVHGSLTVTYK
jgi:hypothetical protein